MKLLFITTLSHVSWGGSEVLWTRTAIQAAKDNHTVCALVYQWANAPKHYADLENNKVRLIHRNTIYDRSFIQKVISRFFKTVEGAPLKRKITAFNPDAIIISQGHTYDLSYQEHKAIYEAINHLNIPYIIICQNNTDYNFVPEKTIREKTKESFKKAYSVLFVSERNKNTAIFNLQYHFQNLKVISNSLSIPQNKIRLLDYPQTDIIHFAVVASLKCSHKGQNLLFDIMSQPKWLERNWVLNLYGRGEDEEFLKELARFLPLTGRVIFHNHKDDIQQIWETNHILLLASFGEGMPLALQEAMLCGRTAIVTDVGGNSELIIDGKTGYLAEGTTFRAFDKAMEKAWSERHLWENLGKKAYEEAMTKIDLNPEKTVLNLITSIQKNQ